MQRKTVERFVNIGLLVTTLLLTAYLVYYFHLRKVSHAATATSTTLSPESAAPRAVSGTNAASSGN